MQYKCYLHHFSTQLLSSGHVSQQSEGQPNCPRQDEVSNLDLDDENIQESSVQPSMAPFLQQMVHSHSFSATLKLGPWGMFKTEALKEIGMWP